MNSAFNMTGPIKWNISIISGLYGFIALLFVSCYEEVNVIPDIDEFEHKKIVFNNSIVAYDNKEQFLLCPVNEGDLKNYEARITTASGSIVGIDGEEVDDNGQVRLDHIRTDKSYNITWDDSGHQGIDRLKFTTLPVLQIFTDEEIPDEPKIPAQVVISDPSNEGFNLYSYAGIELRGNAALYYPKLSYNLELWEKEDFGANNHVPLLNLQADDDWILDAMYMDKARMRNRASFDIWARINEERKKDSDNKVKTHIEGGFVEVFLNGRYQGVYALNERFDQKRMGIQPSEGSLQGLIYKAEGWHGARYEQVPGKPGKRNWGGWELKYPKIYESETWEPFYEYIEFCVNASDQVFVESIDEHLSLESAMDYYIFLNALNASDNDGKNAIMARYDSTSQFLCVPWDLDGTFGRYWDSTKLGTDAVVSLRLFKRLIKLDPNNYTHRLAKRWENLRKNVLTEEVIFELLEEHEQTLTHSGAFGREADRWPDLELNMEYEMAFMQDYMQDRLEFLDQYFDELE